MQHQAEQVYRKTAKQMSQASETSRVNSKPKARDDVPFSELLSFAHDLANLSETSVLKYFRKHTAVENKSQRGFDPVTEADKAAERIIAKTLKSRFPDHSLTGEEFGHVNGSSPYRWVIDPIDGTRAFIMGSPLWGTLIGLLDGDTPVLGLMNQPFTGERYWAGEKASYMRLRDGKPQRIRTRACPRLADAILTTTHPDLFERGHQQDVHKALGRSVRMTRYGGDCYHFALLASGLIDAVFEAGVKSYDVVALIPIIERAGGCMTAWDGGRAINGGNVIATGDPRLHEAALKLISRA